MDLKLKNNQNLTISTFPDSVKAKITTVYIQNCPQINALSLLNSIMSLQESVTPKLSRIRVDIGARAGSYSDLMKFSNLQGFDDDYNFQAKPRFVGSYYIDSWHTIEQLNNARSIFESADFTISNDSTKLINFNDVAVQTLDSTKPNYNPAVAIILQAQGLGITLSEYPFGCGKWFLLKTEAATITYTAGWFVDKTTVTDTNGIVTSDTTRTYNFGNFYEFRYFGTTRIGDGNRPNLGFTKSSLTNIIIPSTMTAIQMATNPNSYGAFRSCTMLETITFETAAFSLVNEGVFAGCISLKSIDLGNCTNTQLPNNTFAGCSSLESVVLPPNCTYIGSRAFQNTTKLGGTMDLSNVTGLGGQPGAAFNNCRVKKFILGEGLTTIPKGYNYQVGYGMFAQNPSLEEVILPSTIATIDGFAFAGCTNLETLIVKATTPPSLYASAIPNNNNLTIYVPASSVNAYKEAATWSNYASKIQAIPV